MKNKEHLIKQLNDILKGEHFIIESYHAYIQNIKHPIEKSKLKFIQEQHKEQAKEISKRIVKLEGKPIQSVSITRKLNQLKKLLLKKIDKEILIEAIKTEQSKVDVYKTIVEDIKDKDSEFLINDIIIENNVIINDLTSIEKAKKQS